MTLLFHLYEQEALAADGTPVTLRYGEKGYNHPSAPAYYEARISQAPEFTRAIMGEGSFGGRSDISYGVLTLLNGDGALDFWVGLAIDGRAFRILLIEDGEAYETAVVVLSGIAHSCVPAGDNGDELQVYLRDRQQEFDTPLQTRLLGGTNVAGIGLDGDANQEGDGLPKGYGPVRNSEPVVVNSALSIYAVNDTLIQGGLTPKVGGVPIPLGIQRASPADLAEMTHAPAPGTVDYFLGAEDLGVFTPCYLRFGTTPAKKVTVDFDGTVRNGRYLETAADIIRDIAVTCVGIDPVDVDEADLALLTTQQPGAVCLYVNSDRDAADAVDAVAQSVGAWWGFDRLSRFRLQRVEDPAALDPVLTIRRFGLGTATTPQDGDAISVAFEKSDQVGWGAIPACGVKLSYDHNPTTLAESDLYGSTGTGDPDPVGGATVRAWLKGEWRIVVWPEDSTVRDAVRARHPLSDWITPETGLRDRVAAVAEAARQFALHGVPRRSVVVPVQEDPAVAAILDLGVVVRLHFSRFGFDEGRTFLVTKLTYRLRDRVADMTVWG